ncbi:unnamed protein product [Absidia cylindrospora]
MSTSNGINMLRMKVAGSITLDSTAYTLGRWLTTMFGVIQLSEATLHISQSTAPSSSMGKLQLPALMLSADSNVTYFDFVTQFVVDDNPTAMIHFCKDAMLLPSVGWQVFGAVPVHVGWLPMENTLNLNKTVDIDGMDGLKQTEMKDMVFPGTHRLGGIALQGTVGIFNPSKTLSMMIGDVDFGIYLPDDDQEGAGMDEMIAVVEAKNTQLKGEYMNYFSVTGRTLPLEDTQTHKRQLMERFLTRYLHGNTSMIHVRGNAFGPEDGGDDISQQQIITAKTTKVPDWLQKTLASIPLTIPFPGTTQTRIIQSMTMAHLQIDFSSVEPTQGPLVTGDVTAMIQLPKEMQIDLNITHIDPDAYLYLTQNATEPFARLHPGHPCPAHTTPPPHDDDHNSRLWRVTSRIIRAPLTVLRQDDFDQFLDQVLNQRNSTVYLDGTAHAMVVSEFGRLMVNDLAFHGKIETLGMQGMLHPPPIVTSLAIIKGFPDALQVKPMLTITNPSDIDMNLGPTTFAMLYKNIEIGNVTIKQLNLLSNTNNIFETDGFIFAQPPTRNKDSFPMVQFIGEYISGLSTELVIAGRKESNRSKFLAPLMKQLHFLIQVPRFDKQPLLQDIQMNILSSTAKIGLRNPFEDIDMQLTTINASAVYQDQPIGTMMANFTTDDGHGALDLPPVWCPNNNNNHSNTLEDDGDGDQDDGCTGYRVETSRMPVSMKKMGWELISKALGGRIELDVDSIVNVGIDYFELTGLHYKRNNITAIVKKSF